MKRFLLLFLIMFSIAACAGVRPKSMVEDEGSEAKIAILRERADGFWSAFVKEDYEKLFYFYDTFFQAKTNKYTLNIFFHLQPQHMNQKPIIINFYIDMLDKNKKIIHRALFFHERYNCDTDSTRARHCLSTV